MNKKYQKFFNTVLDYYEKEGRPNLPWRKNPSPYRVVVSEIMLQQTQVERVETFFNNWIKHFSNWKRLADAQQSEILKYWKGLGYNSRALRLHKLAQIVSRDYKGKLPQDYQSLVALPGIGPYTAGAILAFAYNTYVPFIETNIRRVFIHHFFADRGNVSDAEIFEIIKKMGAIENPRIWYSALMDYGASLPKTLKQNPNKQSKHYSRQSSFKGSDREIRGKILDFLLKEKTLSQKKLFVKLGEEGGRYEKILDQLEKEGFVFQTKNGVTLK
ncbi:MAG: A/G-specific adenine glycosylase [Candidatus Pacebacteria bacterium]|nr:A/G-specific adenine glycosylase [Candidatus Paceibacterota bacterium]